MSALVLLNAEVHVAYAQIYLHSQGADDPDLQKPFQGQANGMCGAAVPGALFLTTGLHTGRVHFTVERHSSAPAGNAGWEDVVEVSFTAITSEVVLQEWNGYRYPLDLPLGQYRVRYAATGMDRGRDLDALVEGPTVDTYLLQFWPAPPEPDRVVRETSQTARMWNRNRGGLAVVEKDRPGTYDRDSRNPHPRLQGLEGYTVGLEGLDNDLLTALADADEATHRQLTRWAADRALVEAGLGELPQLGPVHQAWRRGEPLAPPFTSPYEAYRVLQAVMPSTQIGPIPGWEGEDDEVDTNDQQRCALDAVAATGDTNSLLAAIRTLESAAMTYGPNYMQLFEAVRQAFPALHTGPR